MPCPFLSRLPPSYVRNYGLNLLKSFGSHCPVVSRLTATNGMSAENLPSKCPFLNDVNSPVYKEASQELQSDVIEFPEKNTSGELYKYNFKNKSRSKACSSCLFRYLLLMLNGSLHFRLGL